MPFIENGRTLVPLRAATESLGAIVEWDGMTNTARITKGDNVLIFTQDKPNYILNDSIYPLDMPLKNENNRLFIPLRALGEALGVDVAWDAERSDVFIHTGAAHTTVPPLPATSPEKWRWLVEKYYVTHDHTDPLVGTWYHHSIKTEPVYTVVSSYMFISKCNDERYHIINLTMINEENHGDLILLNHMRYKHQGDLLQIGEKQSLFYHGVVTGFYYTGYGEFILENANLVNIRSFSKYLDDPIELQNHHVVFQPV